VDRLQDAVESIRRREKALLDYVRSDRFSLEGLRISQEDPDRSPERMNSLNPTRPGIAVHESDHVFEACLIAPPTTQRMLAATGKGGS